MNFLESVNYPFAHEDGWKKVAVGAVMSFLSFLILPIFWLTGYLLDVTRSTADGGHPQMPSWGDNTGQRILDGFLAGLIGFIYAIGPFMMAVIGFGGFILSLLFGAAGAQSMESWVPFLGGLALGSAVNFAFGLIGSLLSALVLFITPAIMVRFAVTRNFAAAFNPMTVIGDITAGLGHYLLIFAVALGVGAVMSAITAITAGFGLLICLPLGFYVTLVFAHVKGQYWKMHLAGRQ